MSELRADTISDAAGTGPVALTKQWASRATLNYYQSTNTIRDSENISSTTDSSAGAWSQSYTNSFAAANYPYAGCCANSAETNNGYLSTGATVSTGSQSFTSRRNAALDDSYNGTAAFGDLA